MTVTLETQFSESGQSAPWRNELAKQLNALLWDALKREDRFAGTVLAVVQRVAEFEEITVLKGEE